MASPPYTNSPSALSPPYPSHTQLPPLNTMTGVSGSSNSTGKKRAAATGEGASSPALKRRKASTMSVASNAALSAHPLRQTSFPPDEIEAAATPYSHGARSPSVDSMSLVGSSVAPGPVKKKRGRKSKAEKAREAREQTAASEAGGTGRAASLVSGVGGTGSKSAVGGQGEDDGHDDDNAEVAITANKQTEQEKEEEHRAKGMLINAFNSDQFDRYENWRAVSLSKSAVRRLVNATVSQSVGENTVLSMRGITKLFLGDIIECARRVQGEWIVKTHEKQTDLPTPPPSEHGDPPPVPTIDDRRGPLRPDHLREALRRYKLAQEGGGVGLNPAWNQQQQNGVERFPVRTGGRRIFR